MGTMDRLQKLKPMIDIGGISLPLFRIIDKIFGSRLGRRYQYKILQNADPEDYPRILGDLYQIACVPHLTGEYADQSVNARSLRELIALVPDQNSHLTGENAVRSREQLLVLEGLRKDQLKKLRQCGAFHAYEESKGK